MIQELIFVVGLSFIVLLLYFRLADYFNIIDKPNQRSSHTQPTIRGGGVIFLLGVWLCFVLYQLPVSVAIGVSIAGIVGFWDDISPLTQLPRILAHLTGLGLVMYGLEIFTLPIWAIFTIVLFFTAWVNAFNFMDGINGISGMYAIAVLATFYMVPEMHIHQPSIILMIAVILVFGFFNFRTKARTFAGDIGSISLAFILGYFMLDLIVTTGKPQYILFFLVYALDAAFTIFFRLLKRENIFQPHRTHLYQYLANEYAWNHLTVSSIYASVQLIFNLILIYGFTNDIISIPVSLFIFGSSILIYLVIRNRVVAGIKL
jgi:UDP-N-acetylmuramyl pentapeptide phosphotransferase/UDP-N-acetylglucosamine-1-phosphate transferase